MANYKNNGGSGKHLWSICKCEKCKKRQEDIKIRKITKMNHESIQFNSSFVEEGIRKDARDLMIVGWDEPNFKESGIFKLAERAYIRGTEGK